MRYDLFPVNRPRSVTLCGTNAYPQPEYHPDRVMQEHDLMFVYGGQWQLTQDEETYTVQTGDVILLRAGSHHYAPSPCAANSMNMFIHFTRLPEDQKNVPLTAAQVASYASGDTVCIPTLVHCGTQGEVERLFRAVIEVYWSRREDKQRKLGQLLNLLLAELSHLARQAPADPKGGAWCCELLQTMRREATRFFSLEEAATLAQMNTRSFSARFRKTMGRSFQQYQMETKLQSAYDSLATGPYTVKQVAEMYGFCDPYHFSRVFKKTYGISPREVRQQHSPANINRPSMHWPGRGEGAQAQKLSTPPHPKNERKTT